MSLTIASDRPVGTSALRTDEELRAFADRVSLAEQRRLGLSDDERREYARYFFENLTHIGSGGQHLAAPGFRLRKNAAAQRQATSQPPGAGELDEFDESTAVAALRELEALWARIGYRLAAELLRLFLERKTQVAHDLSRHQGTLVGNPFYWLPLRAHVSKLAAQFGYQPGPHVVSGSDYPAFTSKSTSMAGRSVASYMTGGDFSYAMRLPRFSYKDATLTIVDRPHRGGSASTPSARDAVMVTFRATMQLDEEFSLGGSLAVPSGRQVSDYERAGLFLQHDLANRQRYGGIRWFMHWRERRTYLFVVPRGAMRSERNPGTPSLGLTD